MLRTIEAGSARLALDEVGSGSPTVVFLHAGVADRRSWAAQLTCLACTHRCVAYDRRGFGSTTCDPDEPFSHVADLAAVIGDGPAVLVGNSQGGRIAIDFALAEPERVAGLILAGTAVSGWEVDLTRALSAPERELVQAIDDAELAGDLERMNTLEAQLWLDGLQGVVGRVDTPIRDLFFEMNAVALRAPFLTAEDEPPSAVERLHEIATPTHVVDGALDLQYIRTRTARLAAIIPSARHEIIDGAGHLMALEAPDAFNQLLLDFVEGRDPIRAR